MLCFTDTLYIHICVTVVFEMCSVMAGSGTCVRTVKTAVWPSTFE